VHKFFALDNNHAVHAHSSVPFSLPFLPTSCAFHLRLKMGEPYPLELDCKKVPWNSRQNQLLINMANKVISKAKELVPSPSSFPYLCHSNRYVVLCDSIWFHSFPISLFTHFIKALFENAELREVISQIRNQQDKYAANTYIF
jgi:hypothetical protein